MALRLFLIALFTNLFISLNAIGQSYYLNIKGIDSISQAVTDSISYKKEFNDFKTLSNEIENIYTSILYKGYIDAYYSNAIKENDSSFSSTFSVGVKVNTIRINLRNQIPVYLKSSIGVDVKSDTLQLSIAELELSLNRINTLLIEEGDPFSKLKLTNIKRHSSDLMTADLEVTSNSTRTIDKIIVRGYEKFPKSFIKRYLGIKEGDVFKLEELKSKTEQLSNLIFANQIREPEVLFTKDSTTLYLYIEKNPSNNFDGFLGFGTNEETNKLELDGYLNLQLINNLNFGERLDLSYKSDEIDQQTFNINLQAPYLFKSAIGLEAGLNIFRKDSTFVTTSQKLSLNYQINPRNRIGLGISGVESSNLQDDESSIIQDYSSRFYDLSYAFLKPQYYDNLFPINFQIDFRYGFGNRESDLENLDQSRIELDTFKIFNLNTNNIIYLRFNGAALISDDYFDNELFRFGGINSIRGFEENSLVANLFGVLNTEYRYRLSSTLFVNSVIDAAYYENQITSAKEKLFGFGFGFGLLTKAGLFRFNYASAKTEDQAFRLSNSKVHISLTARF